jgi:hypothetical protein
VVLLKRHESMLCNPARNPKSTKKRKIRPNPPEKEKKKRKKEKKREDHTVFCETS